MHRWDRHKRITVAKIEERIISDREDKHDKVIKYSDKICRWLKTIPQRHRPVRRWKCDSNNDDHPLERVVNKEGLMNKKLSKNMKDKRSLTDGPPVQVKCWVCRLFIGKDGKTKYVDTSWQCKVCKMPLCNVDRSKEEWRKNTGWSCLDYHCNSDLHELQCGEVRPYNKFPKKNQVDVYKGNVPAVTSFLAAAAIPADEISLDSNLPSTSDDEPEAEPPQDTAYDGEAENEAEEKEEEKEGEKEREDEEELPFAKI